ncbi:SEC14-like protein 4 [Folsomia candida]|uniref:SEC14-like protein 4 n=1 Tax=Folsomia candida TaxID=158441 RepID=UPI00160527BA|nr:SEC14-like protein 4 [Folsomia candida]
MRPQLSLDYMKKDIYLIRWLRATRFDIKAAEKMLTENLEWRKENDMENILNEDWSDFESNYPIELQGCDKEGRPVSSGNADDWDVRGVTVSGKLHRGIRYIDRVIEEASAIVRAMQENGDNVTRLVQLIDMRQFNFVQHGCPVCITLYVYAIQTYRDHFPGTVHKVIMLNVPSYFLSIWRLIRHLLPEEERNLIVLHGRDETTWKKALLKDIDYTELTTEYGGVNKDAPVEITEVALHRAGLSCERLRAMRKEMSKYRL